MALNSKHKFRISGVLRSNEDEVVIDVDAETMENARAKAELRGIIVTSVTQLDRPLTESELHSEQLQHLGMNSAEAKTYAAASTKRSRAGKSQASFWGSLAVICSIAEFFLIVFIVYKSFFYIKPYQTQDGESIFAEQRRQVTWEKEKAEWEDSGFYLFGGIALATLVVGTVSGWVYYASTTEDSASS